MANFYQHGQQVHGNQVNTDFADLRGAALPVPGRVGQPDEVMSELRAVLDGLRRAAELGLVDRAAADAVAGEIDGAIGALNSGASGAATGRVEKAVKALQAAAPVAVIAGALSSVWGALSGGTS
jgi:hypothetical protein